jgi:hypothetical protein
MDHPPPVTMTWTRRLVAACLAVPFATALGGCAESTAEPVLPDGTGSFEGRWNGEAWKGHGYAVLVDDTLYLLGHRQRDPRLYPDEFVRVETRFLGEGTFHLASGDASLDEVVGGDAGYFTPAGGTLSLSRFDEERARLEGTVTLTGEGPNGVMRFEGGSFRVPVYTSFSAVPPHD